MPTPSYVRRALAVLAISGLTLATAGPAFAAKPTPEGNAQAKPNDDAGYFLGYPSETLQWHGCTKTSTQQTPATLDDGVPAPGAGTAHKKVTWTTTTTAAATSGYVLSWKVAKGWKICGAEAAILGSDDHATFDLAMEVGYTSKGTTGSTVTSGSETIVTKLSKQDCKELGVDPQFKGTWGIRTIYAVTVFIKKAR